MPNSDKWCWEVMVTIKRCPLDLVTRRSLWPLVGHLPDSWRVKARLQCIEEWVEVKVRPVLQDTCLWPRKKNNVASNQPCGFLNTQNVTWAQGKVVRIVGLHLASISPKKPSLGDLGWVPHEAPYSQRYHLCATCPARKTIFPSGRGSYPSVSRNTSIYKTELSAASSYSQQQHQLLLLQLDFKEHVVYPLTTLYYVFFKNNLMPWTHLSTSYNWGKWRSKKLRYLPQIIWLLGGRAWNQAIYLTLLEHLCSPQSLLNKSILLKIDQGLMMLT